MEFFDSFIIYFGYFVLFSFVLGIMGFIILSIDNSFLDNPKKINTVGLILIGQLLFFVFLLFLFHSRFSNNLIREITQIINSEELQISINNKIILNPQKDIFLSELKSIRQISTNHTTPIFEINVNLIAKDKKIHLSLGRDSGDSTLYWIFVKDYKTSSIHEIGHIRTKLLNSIL